MPTPSGSLEVPSVCSGVSSLSVHLPFVRSILAFTKVLRPVAAFLRTLGVRMIVYIDNNIMLIMGES